MPTQRIESLDSLQKASPAIGVAYAGYLEEFLGKFPDAFDYVEIPFELLRHNPSVLRLVEIKPTVLHCASLSMVGNIDSSATTIKEIQSWIAATKTPWLGEHLAFISAQGLFDQTPEPDALQPYHIGYTVSPLMNQITVDRVVGRHERYLQMLGLPILLENSPVYFRMPGSTLSQTEFIQQICERSSALLLLDLTHWYITSKQMKFDPFEELLRLPLNRVIEVHISGVDDQEGICWDNHAARAPKIVHDLLAEVLRLTPVRAITLEYNWSRRFPQAALFDELSMVKEAIATSMSYDA